MSVIWQMDGIQNMLILNCEEKVDHIGYNLIKGVSSPLFLL
ncbi:hypothetical protein BSSX_p0118 (plasmid) [Bacillus subtilis]|nr:hypothetical protein BSSX_p0118 [Bacillus subtilis]